MKHLFQNISALAIVFTACAISKDCKKVRQYLEANSYVVLSDLTHDAFNEICRGGLETVKERVIDTCGAALHAEIEVQCCIQCVTDGRQAKRGCQERIHKRIQRALNGKVTDEECQNSIRNFRSAFLLRKL